MCIDEFEKLPLPLLPFPGWEARARDEAINKWSVSREKLLASAQPHALIVALRSDAERGRYFAGVDDDLMGFADLMSPSRLPKAAEAEEQAQQQVDEQARREAVSSD